MAVHWEKVYVFISSTFNDMHAERDYLIKDVFPQLADWCESRKLRLVDVDLRWGVTEQDATQNRNVVQVCLERIDDCRPFFLCFLGQRYGWTPGPDDISNETMERFPRLTEILDEGRSVTELEIMHALIRPFHSGSTSLSDCAFFYFRCPSYLSKLPEQPEYLIRIYTDQAEKDVVRKKALLGKQTYLKHVLIPRTGRRGRYYQAEWLPDQSTPELAIPLQCPALLKENVERWRAQWDEVAGVKASASQTSLLDRIKRWSRNQSNSDRNEISDPAESKKAAVFNEKLTRGRPGDFKCDREPLRDVILNDLQAAISARFPDHVPAISQTALQKEMDQQHHFLFVQSEGFVSRGDDFSELDAYTIGPTNKIFFLTGEGGLGKSMLLANWIESCLKNPDRFGKTTFHFRFVGQSDLSNRVEDVLFSLLSELQEVANKIPLFTTQIRDLPDGKKETATLPLKIPSDPVPLRESWTDLLEMAGAQGKTVIVIDALDQLESGLDDLAWLPWELPENVRLIVSFKRQAQTSSIETSLRDNPQSIVSEILSFDRMEDRRKLVRSYLMQYLKELDDNLLNAVIQLPGAGNPLYLKVVLSELRVFGAFANLRNKIRDDFGDGPNTAFLAVLSRLENDPAYSPVPPQTAVPLLFGLLVHSRRGLSADELVEMFLQVLNPGKYTRKEITDAVYLQLRQVRSFLSRREGRYDFFYESFRSAAGRRYVCTDSKQPGQRLRCEWHTILADYFNALPLRENQTNIPVRRKVSELPFHLIQSEQWERLTETLCSLQFVEAKCSAGMTYDLVSDYQAAIEALPERKAEREVEASSEERIARFTREQVVYAAGKGPLPQIPVSTPPWQNERIESESERIRKETSRLSRIRAFFAFVNAESHHLANHGTRSGFCVQQAYNLMRDGPVGIAAKAAIESQKAPLLLRRHLTRPVYNPHSSLIRIIECGDYSYHRNRRILAASNDGSVAVCEGAKNTLRVWDLKTGKCKKIIKGLYKNIIAITPDGRLLVSGSGYSPIRIHEVATGREVRILDSKHVSALAVTADGSRVVSGDGGGRVHVWDTINGELKKTIQAHGLEIKMLDLTGDGHLAAVVSENAFSVLNLETEKQMRFEHGGDRDSPTTAAISLNGQVVVSACNERLFLWLVGEARSAGVLTGHSKTILAAAATPDFRLIISGGWDHTVRIWETATGQCLRIFEGHTGTITSVWITIDGRRAISQADDGTLRVWDVEKGSVSEPPHHPGSVSTFISETSTEIFSGSKEKQHSIRMWSPDGTCKKTISGESNYDHRTSGGTSLMDSLPGGKLLAKDEWDFACAIWDIKSGKCLHFLPHSNYIWRFVTSPDGSRIISVSADKTIRMWNPETGDCERTWSNSSAGVHYVAISPDGRRIATAHGDQHVRVWDIEKNEPVYILRGHKENAKLVSFTPDGRLLISAGGDFSSTADTNDAAIRIWNLDTGKLLSTLTGHTRSIEALAITPDGRTLVTGGWDYTIRVWDIKQGKCRFKIEESAPVNELVITSDGRYVYPVKLQNELTLFDLSEMRNIALCKFRSAVVAMANKNDLVVACDRSGHMHFLETRNLAAFPSVTTIVRLYRSDQLAWDAKFTAKCFRCGLRFEPDERHIGYIARLQQLYSGIPVLHAPLESWVDPQLITNCPACRQQLHFNPFIVDNSE
ncbi:DUF4062 domain-containing protein [bacterium]|nr:DUF4062 domain-containing protein [bacterium]